MRLNDVLKYRRAIESGSNLVERDDEAILQIYGIYPEWESGKHKVGEIYNAINQTWECYLEYDNAVYPDIVPGESAWYTFNRPLHGKTKETAREWVTPTGAHDTYKYGEWMIWIDGVLYQCIAPNGTNFSPTEYPEGWICEK